MRRFILRKGPDCQVEHYGPACGELVYATDTEKAYIGTGDGHKEIGEYGSWVISNNLLGETVDDFILRVEVLAITDKDAAIGLLIEKFRKLCPNIHDPMLRDIYERYDGRI